MTTDIAHRIPKNSSQVLPVIRQDATPIPDYFLDQIMPHLPATHVKVALAIFREMHKRGDDEIITYGNQLKVLCGLDPKLINYCLRLFHEKGFFHITYLEKQRMVGNNNSYTPIKIKFNNRVNYSIKD